jgi:RNA polymerase sigma factor (sigma-70 family)
VVSPWSIIYLSAFASETELIVGGVNVTDWFLLRKFKDDRSQSAFAEIVDRYINLVYAACYANLQDRQAAEDATQAVFLILARKSEFRRGSTMVGWLFRTARYVSMHARRDEIRRRKLQAAVDLESDHYGSQPWSGSDTRLILNDAIARLGDIEREAVLLRYYQAMPLKDVGEALGISEEAARKRIDRGVDKLRRYLAVTDSVAAGLALSTLLDGHGTNLLSDFQHQAVAQTITVNAALGQTASVTVAHQLTLEVMKRMVITKIRIAAVCVAIAAVGGSGTAYVLGQGNAGSTSVTKSKLLPIKAEQPVTPPALNNAAQQRQYSERDAHMESMRRLKMLGLAVLEFAQDSNEKLPPLDSDASIWNALRKYAKSRTNFIQPGTNKPYRFNSGLSNVLLSKVEAPAGMALAYEVFPDTHGYRYVVYVDGHVKMEPEAEWLKVKKYSHIP